jgi:hypothetical protein
MASPAQIAANLANARKSTGPRTPEGKAQSRMNALQHGAYAQAPIIPGEDPAAFQEIHAFYHHTYQPTDPGAQALVDTVIRSTWLLRRLFRAETAVTASLIEQANGDLGQAFLNDAAGPNVLGKLHRQIAALERARQQSLIHLERLQQILDQVAEAEPLSPELASFPTPPPFGPEFDLPLPDLAGFPTSTPRPDAESRPSCAA